MLSRSRDLSLSGAPSDVAVQAPSLAGLRLVVSAIDLEQREHRGIAVYSKALLRTLSQAGAEVWLLTEFSADLQQVALRRLPRPTRSLLQAAQVLDALLCGRSARSERSLRRQLIQRLPLGQTLLRRWDSGRELCRQLFPRRRFPCAQQVKLTVHDLTDNPYLQHERLAYLEWVHGIISVPDVYVHSMRLAGQKSGPVAVLDLSGFDGFISTCPLNIKACGVSFTLQTVHDLIPLEFYQTSDQPSIFARRLACCGDAARLFMSTSTASKFRWSIPSGCCPLEDVVVQPPSLHFPRPSPVPPAELSPLHPIAAAATKQSMLRPFRYLLFNSSLEPRKNLVYALNAYRESGLARLGVPFCVTGSLKADVYSDEVRRLVQHDPHVILTDFIDESMRRYLFLNALALVSPSLVEGFGIPVLDAACLGLVVLASPSASHREIQAMHDFRTYVWLCDNLDSSQLAASMRLVVLQDRVNTLNPEERRRQRLHRYRDLQERIDQEFRRRVVRLIRAAIDAQGQSRSWTTEKTAQASGPA